MGLYPGLPPGPVPLGSECSGTVVAVGEGVGHVAIGQPVMALAAGCFGRFVTTSAELVAPKPALLAFEEAATMPVAFMTVVYSLRHLARLRRGERILIHAAAGGVGLAAIRFAQRMGAEVFATAGSPEKRALLAGLGVQHVMDSRSAAFADQVMSATNGQGVDVVVNSLAGDLMLKSLELVSPYGRFLELGKRDLYSNRQVGLWPLRKGVSYFAVDLAGLAEARPSEFAELWREVTGEIASGIWKPLQHLSFPVSAAVDAFRWMAQGKHTGKIVLNLNDRRDVQVASGRMAIHSDATYLITGGLGGLGLTVARWLVEQGARYIALLGRSEPSAEALANIKSLEHSGARVLVSRADVADAAGLRRAVEDIESRMPALRGVVHAAGVLDDGLLLRMDAQRLRNVMAPKVAGAWNLHTLTLGRELDFFVLFSSASSMLGAPGQANYAAANAFLDALAHYRRAQGLPALSINWGPWADVGAAAQPDRGGRLALRGIASLAPERALEAMDWLMNSGAVQAGVLALNLRQWREFYPKAADFPLLEHLLSTANESAVATREGVLRNTLLAAEAGQRQQLLEDYLKQQLGEVLRLAPSRIDRQTPLSTLGLDSLMALELRNRLEAGAEVTLSATLVWNYPSIAALAPYLADKMGIAMEAASAENAAPPDDLIAILGAAGKLSEDELRRMVAGASPN